MISTGDRVKYKDTIGVVKSVLDDMVIVTMSDGKDYAMPYDALTKESGERVSAPENFSGIVEALKPHLKNVTFLTEMAKEMHRAGVGELSVINGAIQKFSAKESLDEKLAKYKEIAMKEAEEKARREFEEENKVV